MAEKLSIEQKNHKEWTSHAQIKGPDNESEMSKITQKLNMTQLYYKDDDEKLEIPKFQQNKQKLKQMHKNLPQIVEQKIRSQVFSGISFSKFQAISEISDSQQKSANKQQQKSSKSLPKPQSINRIPTSTKIISSKNIIQNPIQIKQFPSQLKPPNRMLCESYTEHEQIIHFNYIQPKQMIQKFINFCKLKQMQIKDNANFLLVIKKVQFYKSVLSFCFPKSAQYEDQAYQFTCQTDKYAKIVHLSGSNEKFMKFKDEFMVQLWKDKYLVCGSLQENLKYFLIHANKFLMRNDNKQNNIGEIDYLKGEAQRIIKKMFLNKNMAHAKNKQQQKSKPSNSNQNDNDKEKKKLQQDILEIQNNFELNELIVKIKATEQLLRTLFQKQMKKQESIKLQRSSQSKIKIEQKQLEQNKMLQNVQKRVLVTPSIQRMLYTMFYLQLNLEDIVRKFWVKQKNINDFQQKKMILKGSLNNHDIFKYIQLQQFYKSLHPKNSKPQKNSILPNSIKILTSLTYQNYPSPNQSLQLISIFKNTLLKQIDTLGANSIKVKLQDHNNQDRTLLQFCIYCVIMCDNPEIYSTVETTIVFCNKKEEKFRIMHEDSYHTLKVLKKAIDFVENKWEL